MEGDIVLFESDDGQVVLPVHVDAKGREIWLSRAQLAVLFGRDVKTIGKHINNSLREELAGQEEVVVAKFATTTKHGAIEGKTQTRLTEHYGLDMILSVGYRVKSKRGAEFRRWATDVLRRYIVDGNAANEQRLRQLGQVASVMARIPESLETRQVLDIVQSYTAALDLLDDYDHQRIGRPKQGAKAVYELSYDECISVIKSMRFGAESDLFGVEKDDSFKSSIGNIYQTFGGRDIYPTLQEKAANLLYFVVKNHSFLDGNKRIAATVFLYFLDRNDALFVGGRKSIGDSTLVAVTVMIAESKPEEKDAMVALVMNFLAMGLGN
ncbi:virulence protein RhuM/Fic/DOC family protein [uncultured Senegalimassilia sp.]|uniref:virulence protein RhuM/Fic/DOC family protein n=1 Tax=uncultured Senegalimassilia sp. TaxID=1714350 RepID=UPI0026E00EDB|nr:virulence protein RhuM/Fic/DOC family protein [uncultured Senegalimassilia sp.]